MRSSVFKNPVPILLVLIAVTLVVFFASVIEAPNSQPSSTAGISLDTNSWRTCRNEIAGYELKYPAQWFVYGDGSFDLSSGFVKENPCIGLNVAVAPKRLTTIDSWNPDSSPSYFSVHLPAQVIVNDGRERGSIVLEGVTTLEGYLDRVTPITGKEYKDTVVDRERAVWWSTQGFKEIMVFHDGHLFRIHERNLPLPIFDAIVSTFRFLR